MLIMTNDLLNHSVVRMVFGLKKRKESKANRRQYRLVIASQLIHI